MSASASGANPNGNASTPKSREHNQGNQDRKYTIEQKTAVIRIRKCQPTSFYEILSLEKTASDGEIKKAYRKLSLLTHPDKNGYDGADEAFKLVSRAFQVLSDPDKKSKHDQFGGDPDSRFNPSSASSSTSSPFSNFARSQGGGMGGGMGGGFHEEISPEELFNRFFGGGGGFGGSPFGGGIFDTGPGFVFNMGGGPGVRVHQFGGGRPRRRPASANDANAQGSSGFAGLTQLLPLLLIFILPILSSLFSGSSSSSRGPSVRFDNPVSPHTMQRTTPKLKINYFVNPNDVSEYTQKNFYNLDSRAEVEFVSQLRYDCQTERETREQIVRDASGLFWNDEQRIREAYATRLEACERLESLGLRLQTY